MGGWVGGWVGKTYQEVLHQDEGLAVNAHPVPIDENTGDCGQSNLAGEGLVQSFCSVPRWVGGWVGGWVDRGERGGSNEVLDLMGGWVGGKKDLLCQHFVDGYVRAFL